MTNPGKPASKRDSSKLSRSSCSTRGKVRRGQQVPVALQQFLGEQPELIGVHVRHRIDERRQAGDHLVVRFDAFEHLFAHGLGLRGKDLLVPAQRIFPGSENEHDGEHRAQQRDQYGERRSPPAREV